MFCGRELRCDFADLGLLPYTASKRLRRLCRCRSCCHTSHTYKSKRRWCLLQTFGREHPTKASYDRSSILLCHRARLFTIHLFAALHHCIVIAFVPAAMSSFCIPFLKLFDIEVTCSVDLAPHTANTRFCAARLVWGDSCGAAAVLLARVWLSRQFWYQCCCTTCSAWSFGVDRGTQLGRSSLQAHDQSTEQRCTSRSQQESMFFGIAYVCYTVVQAEPCWPD